MEPIRSYYSFCFFSLFYSPHSHPTLCSLSGTRSSRCTFTLSSRQMFYALKYVWCYKHICYKDSKLILPAVFQMFLLLMPTSMVSQIEKQIRPRMKTTTTEKIVFTILLSLLFFIFCCSCQYMVVCLLISSILPGSRMVIWFNRSVCFRNAMMLVKW